MELSESETMSLVVEPETTTSSPLTGAVPPQFAPLLQNESPPPPVQVLVEASAVDAAKRKAMASERRREGRMTGLRRKFYARMDGWQRTCSRHRRASSHHRPDLRSRAAAATADGCGARPRVSEPDDCVG